MESRDVTPETARHHLEALDADGAAVSGSTGVPFWYVLLQSCCISGFVLSFGLGPWESAGFALSAVALVLLGMLRPLITGTRADPWAYPASVRVALTFIGCAALAVGIGMVVSKSGGSMALLFAAALLTFAATLVLGLRMERALVRSIHGQP